MKLQYIIIGIIVSLIPTLYGLAQSKALKPEVGKGMPEFGFSNVKNYDKGKASLDDFKGKWLFLDFWAQSCSSCIESFPKLNELQEQFPEVQFLLVGLNYQRDNKGIEKLFDRVSKNRHLKIAAAFDSVLFRAWNIRSVPHIYIIDPGGIVRFITGGRDLTREKIRRLLEGKEVSFYPKSAGDDRSDFDVTKVFGEGQLLNASILTRWNGEQQNSGCEIDRFVKSSKEEQQKGWVVAMAPLFELYNYAYLGRGFWLTYDSAFYGKVYAYPILEISDSAAFQYDYTFDIGKNTYNYCLKIPDEKVSDETIMNELQRTLNYAFGYKVSVEKRQMPVWKLIANKGTARKIRSKGGRPYRSERSLAAGFTLINQTMNQFLSALQSSLPNNERLAFVDDTGMEGNIDITIDADMTSYESVRTVLHEYGMDLVKGRKEMKVLVIRDP